MNIKIRVAIIGSGIIAEEYIKVVVNLPDLTIDGIYSRNTLKARNLSIKYNIPVEATSIENLFERTKAHFVIIAVSADSNFSVTSETMQYPWKIFAEKPLGLNLNEYEELVKDVNSDRVYAALNRRFYPSVQHLKNSISQTEGNIIINCLDQENVTVAKNFGHSDEVINSWPYANSIHLIDLLTYFSRGNVESVNTIIGSQPRLSRDGTSIVKISFDSGDTALYTTIWNQPAPWQINIWNNQDYYELRPIESLYQWDENQRKFQSLIKSNTNFKPGFAEQIQEFRNEILEGNSKLIKIKDCISTYKLIEKIYE